jgi:hypothetical protein
MWQQLDDLDFADDLALLSHTHKQMQEKTDTVSSSSKSVGLSIHKSKSKVLRICTDCQTPIQLRGENLEEVEEFTYLGSIVDKEGGTDADVKARIRKARAAFILLKNIWRSKEITTGTKIRLFNTNVKAVLLYGSDTWRINVSTIKILQTFINSCLRRIMGIYWPDTISNEELWERAHQPPLAKVIVQRRWRWIGHTLRKPATNTTRHALKWTPQGKRKRGRPRNTWRRELSADLERMGHTWSGLEKMAKDREEWRNLVSGLCPRRGSRPK